MSMNVVIFGNSGSGKSTLAINLSQEHQLAHLDLDTVAWQDTDPPQRKPLSESVKLINDFVQANKSWVLEGCYADLIETVLPVAKQMIYLDLPTDLCIQNAKLRPWEPHKYESKQAQDANLQMLVDWISQYDKRTDDFSRSAHRKIYEQFKRAKLRLTENNKGLISLF